MSASPPVRVVAVMPEPTPYRSPLFDRIAGRPEVDLTVVYNAPAIAGNDWRLAPEHPNVMLRGQRVPGADRILRHHYPITPGVFRVLERVRPDCVVLTGWSTFASQCAIAWCRVRRVPYVLVVESHDRGSRRAWRRAVKGAVVPWVVRGATSVLAAGSLARESMIARGADADRVRTFANTVDVAELAARVDDLRESRDRLRGELGLAADDVAVLCVARLALEKGIDVLLQAAARVGAPVSVLLAGDGPERSRLEQLGGRVTFLGVRPWESLAEVYAAADVFALLSRFETWGVVVNEAAAAALPLVVSEGAGAAHDLVREGENGFVVGIDDVDAVAQALGALAADPELRRRYGDASRRIVGDWGYERSEEDFIAAVLEAAGSTLAA